MAESLVSMSASLSSIFWSRLDWTFFKSEVVAQPERVNVSNVKRKQTKFCNYFHPDQKIFTR